MMKGVVGAAGAAGAEGVVEGMGMGMPRRWGQDKDCILVALVSFIDEQRDWNREEGEDWED
jgi:hypothetical protein